MEILGIDIGGTGIKGAPVDIDKGVLVSERYRIRTPEPATPDAVADVVAELAAHFDWKGPLGCTFPAVIKGGVAHTAANVDKAWIGTNAAQLFTDRSGCPSRVINDADAAGVAEMHFGAGKGKAGTIFMLTFGTGIGSAIFTNGLLVPNTELGHMDIRGKEAEHRASDKARRDDGINWSKWAERVTEYLNVLEALFWPDLFIIGGGVSKKPQKFLDNLKTRTPVVPAELQNEAGIVGAAMWASGREEICGPLLALADGPVE